MRIIDIGTRGNVVRFVMSQDSGVDHKAVGYIDVAFNFDMIVAPADDEVFEDALAGKFPILIVFSEEQIESGNNINLDDENVFKYFIGESETELIAKLHDSGKILGIVVEDPHGMS